MYIGGFDCLKISQTKNASRTLSVSCPRLAESCFFIRLLFYTSKPPYTMQAACTNLTV